MNVDETSTGLTGTLVSISNSMTGDLGDDISPLTLEVVFETDERVNVKITDTNNDRWEIPEAVVPKPSVSPSKSSEFVVSYENSPFSLTISRADDGSEVVTLGSSLIYKDQFIQLNVVPGGSEVETYGIGENSQVSYQTPTGTFSLWAHDTPSAAFNTNLYGSHPFFIQTDRASSSSSSSYGGFMRNSNGMDVTLGGDGAVTFKMQGGVVDLSFFAGPTPREVAAQYQELIGFPKMQPYWSLGFHNCKYGYESIDQVEEVVDGYASASIPLDTQWMDIDYMDAYKDFTLDAKNFPQDEVSSFISTLHKNGQKFVPIIDPGIMVEEGYDAYDEGIAKDLFIKDLGGEDPYIGQVWPGPTHFPDWFHDDAQDYWTDQIAAFHSYVGGDKTGGVDGLWIDMNEIANFCNGDGNAQVCTIPTDGSCPNINAQTSCCLECSVVDEDNSLDFPPYSLATNGALGSKTVSPSAVHVDNITEYNVHNMFGLMEGIATKVSLEELLEKRSFVLSRSTFPSSGTHNAHWTGDNEASFQDLQASIVQTSNFNMFGTSMVGADICGFMGSTNEELCNRWIEVGAFYPFSRNHNTLGADPQELYLWDTVTEASQTYLGMRYRLLPYLYTLMYEAHMTGSPVFTNLYMNYPDDEESAGENGEFMWGDALLFLPVLDNGYTSVEGYFPPDLSGKFVNMEDFGDVVDVSDGSVSKTLDTPLTSTNVFVRGYEILPMKEDGGLTTVENRESPFTLLVSLCMGGGGEGSLFWDDGDQIELEEYTYTTFEAHDFTSLSSTVVNGDVGGAIGSATVIGVPSKPASMTLNGKTAVTSFTYDLSTSTLSIDMSDLGIEINEEFSLTWA